MKNFNLSLLFLACAAFFHTPVFSQWTKTNGLAGGAVNGFFHAGDTVFAYGNAAIYYSTTQGATWTDTKIALPSSTIYTLVTRGKTLLYQGYDYGLGVSNLYHSSDFGQNWTIIPTADTMLFYDLLLYDNYIYGGDYHGVYRTADFGATWEYVTAKQTSELQSNGTALFGHQYPNVVRSDDGGLTWTTLFSGSGSYLVVDEDIMVLFNSGAGGKISTDGGLTWESFSGGAPGPNISSNENFIINGSLYRIFSDLIFKSDDLGKTWSILDPPNVSYSRAITEVDDYLLVGTYYNGVVRSNDGGHSWWDASVGLLNDAPSTLRSTGGNLFALGYSSALHPLAPDGINWENWNVPFANPNSQTSFTDVMKTGDYWLVSGGYYGTQVSIDGGATWVESFIAGSNFSFGGPGRLEKAAGNIIGFGTDSDFYTFYVSENDGLSFFPLEENFPGWPQNRVDLLDVDQGQVYAVGYDKKFYHSTDGATTWELLGNIPLLDSISYTGISLSDLLFVRGQTIFIFSDEYKPELRKMLYSNDLGKTWQLIYLKNANYPFGSVNLTNIKKIGSYLIACNSQGIFISKNDGQSWASWNEGFATSPSVSTIEIHDSYVWAAVNGQGIWKRSLAELDFKSADGLVFFDKNANGQLDTDENGQPDVIVKSLTTGASATANSKGQFLWLSDLPSEELAVQPPKNYWKSVPAKQVVQFPSTATRFALQLDPAVRDLSVDLTNVTVFRPGFDSKILLSWKNDVPTPASDVKIRLTYPPDLLEFQSATILPTNQTPGQFIWEIGTLDADASGFCTLKFSVPTTTPLGTLICLTADIEPLTDDRQPSDNHSETCAEVRGSYDPNDKQSWPDERISTTQLAQNQAIAYTVRFQNTGTYPANFVIIRDTLAAEFEVESFRFVAASHPCQWRLRGRALEFYFENIQLPDDKTDEPGSHGFVKYEVRARQNLPL